MRSLSRVSLLIAALSIFALAAGAPEYKVLQTYKPGGEGGWDYLIADGGSRNVFISRGTHVMVVNGDTGQPTGDIPDTPGVHGIALANDLNKGFISNGRGNSVTVFDLKTLKTTNTIKLEGAQNPDAILYDPPSKRVFTFNGRSSNATAIDATNDTVVGNIALDGKPEFAVSDGRGMVYVNIEDKSELTQIDARKATVVKSWPLTGCEEPSGLAMDQKGRYRRRDCYSGHRRGCGRQCLRCRPPPGFQFQRRWHADHRETGRRQLHRGAKPANRPRGADYGARSQDPQHLSGDRRDRRGAARCGRDAPAAHYEARNILPAGGGKEIEGIIPGEASGPRCSSLLRVGPSGRPESFVRGLRKLRPRSRFTRVHGCSPVVRGLRKLRPRRRFARVHGCSPIVRELRKLRCFALASRATCVHMAASKVNSCSILSKLRCASPRRCCSPAMDFRRDWTLSSWSLSSLV